MVNPFLGKARLDVRRIKKTGGIGHEESEMGIVIVRRPIHQLPWFEPLDALTAKRCPNRRIFLPALATEAQPEQSLFTVRFRLKALSVQRDVPSARSLQSRIHITTACDELMKPKGKEAAAYGIPPLVREHEELLETPGHLGKVAAAIIGELFRGRLERSRSADSHPLSVLAIEPEIEFDPGG